MPQQQLAYDYAMPRARIALFMEMRLGKTLVAIRWAVDSGLNRVLVVCPKSVIDTWVEALKTDLWADHEICILDDAKDKRVDHIELDAKWFIIGYESLLATPEIFTSPWCGIILDESTKIRNPQADITKLLMKHRDKFGYRACLSGLPAPESLY